MVKSITIIFSSLCLFSCNSGIKQKTVSKDITLLSLYDFDKPDGIIKLPKELNEISGISFINDSIVAAISDGKPYLYIYNLQQQTIASKIEVAVDGDFEDLTVCGDTVYIIQSNGILWTISNFNSTPLITSTTLPLEHPFELEGMCRNSTKDTLFIAAKYWHRQDSLDENELPVWAYAIRQNKLIDKPLFYIPATIALEKKKHLFHTSGISKINENPTWIAISTNKKYIAELTSSGKRDAIISLEQDVFTQPEGIDMDSKANIYISNEGKNDRANILKFSKNGNEKRTYN